MTTTEKHNQPTILQIAETGRLINQLEKELGLRPVISRQNMREAVSILISAPTYWMQSVRQRLDNVRDLAGLLELGETV